MQTLDVSETNTLLHGHYNLLWKCGVNERNDITQNNVNSVS